ncbi:MAG TPA: pilus assembly protein TadG-related protein, partial [Rhizomicrobium sp.]|nr:pilus assembly protein TadG-related protein [Rhizomicrobium sp.]
MSRTRKLIATARDFLRCKRGNIAMIFGVAVVPIMIGAGAGLDFARAMMVRQQMAEALDAAALAVGSTPGLDA